MKEEIKEDFCPPCLAAIPLAFAATGAGASQVIDGSTDEGKKNKNMLKTVSLWVFLIFISCVLTYLMWLFCKWILIKLFKCNDCK
jgi:hypothetical protein